MNGIKTSKLLTIAYLFGVGIGLFSCGSENKESEPKETVNLTASNLTEDGYFDGIIYYKITSNSPYEVIISKAAKAATKVAIPARIVIEGITYQCTSIDKQAFRGCSNMVSLSIPNTISSIGDDAFGGCRSLITLTVPDNIKFIGERAFNGCTALKTITLPKSLTVISSSLFQECTSLESIKIPSNVTSINGKAFQGCSELKSVLFPDHLAYIYNNAFSSCKNLKSIEINASCFIGDNAFAFCNKLETVTLSNYLYCIGVRAFQDCLNLETIHFGALFVGANAFCGCKKIKKVYSTFVVPHVYKSAVFEDEEGNQFVTGSDYPLNDNNYNIRGSSNLSNKPFTYKVSETINTDVFDSNVYSNATLSISKLYVDRYLSTKYCWSKFTNIVKDTGNGEEVIIPQGNGTIEYPYNVATTQALIQRLGADVQSEEIYVKGFISQIDDISPVPETTYGNATYWISDQKGSTARQLEIYRGYSLGGEKFTSKDEIKEGDEVIVKGKVVNFRGNTPEFISGSSIYSLNGKTAVDKPAKETIGNPNNPITVTRAVELINTLPYGGTTEQDAYIIGKISTIKTMNTDIAKYKTIDYIISDGTHELTVFRGKNLNNTDFNEAGQINVGDEVVVIGKLMKFVDNNGKMIPEVAQGNYIVKLTKGSGTPETGIKTVTVAEFIAAAESNDVWYQLTGTVNNLKDNDLYGNFDLVDSTGSVYVYGVLSEKGGEKKKFQELVAAKGIKNGSTITIIGNRGSYNGKIEVMNAYFVSVSN